MEHPIKMDDLGGPPLFSKNTHMLVAAAPNLFFFRLPPPMARHAAGTLRRENFRRQEKAPRLSKSHQENSMPHRLHAFSSHNKYFLALKKKSTMKGTI